MEATKTDLKDNAASAAVSALELNISDRSTFPSTASGLNTTSSAASHSLDTRSATSVTETGLELNVKGSNTVYDNLEQYIGRRSGSETDKKPEQEVQNVKKLEEKETSDTTSGLLLLPTESVKLNIESSGIVPEPASVQELTSYDYLCVTSSGNVLPPEEENQYRDIPLTQDTSSSPTELENPFHLVHDDCATMLENNRERADFTFNKSVTFTTGDNAETGETAVPSDMKFENLCSKDVQHDNDLRLDIICAETESVDVGGMTTSRTMSSLSDAGRMTDNSLSSFPEEHMFESVGVQPAEKSLITDASPETYLSLGETRETVDTDSRTESRSSSSITSPGVGHDGKDDLLCEDMSASEISGEKPHITFVDRESDGSVSKPDCTVLTKRENSMTSNIENSQPTDESNRIPLSSVATDVDVYSFTFIEPFNDGENISQGSEEKLTDVESGLTCEFPLQILRGDTDSGSNIIFDSVALTSTRTGEKDSELSVSLEDQTSSNEERSVILRIPSKPSSSNEADVKKDGIAMFVKTSGASSCTTESIIQESNASSFDVSSDATEPTSFGSSTLKPIGENVSDAHSSHAMPPTVLPTDAASSQVSIDELHFSTATESNNQVVEAEKLHMPFTDSSEQVGATGKLHSRGKQVSTPSHGNEVKISSESVEFVSSDDQKYSEQLPISDSNLCRLELEETKDGQDGCVDNLSPERSNPQYEEERVCRPQHAPVESATAGEKCGPASSEVGQFRPESREAVYIDDEDPSLAVDVMYRRTSDLFLTPCLNEDSPGPRVYHHSNLLHPATTDPEDGLQERGVGVRYLDDDDGNDHVLSIGEMKEYKAILGESCPVDDDSQKAQVLVGDAGARDIIQISDCSSSMDPEVILLDSPAEDVNQSRFLFPFTEDCSDGSGSFNSLLSGISRRSSDSSFHSATDFPGTTGVETDRNGEDVPRHESSCDISDGESLYGSAVFTPSLSQATGDGISSTELWSKLFEVNRTELSENIGASSDSPSDPDTGVLEWEENSFYEDHGGFDIDSSKHENHNGLSVAGYVYLDKIPPEDGDHSVEVDSLDEHSVNDDDFFEECTIDFGKQPEMVRSASWDETQSGQLSLQQSPLFSQQDHFSAVSSSESEWGPPRLARFVTLDSLQVEDLQGEGLSLFENYTPSETIEEVEEEEEEEEDEVLGQEDELSVCLRRKSSAHPAEFSRLSIIVEEENEESEDVWSSAVSSLDVSRSEDSDLNPLPSPINAPSCLHPLASSESASSQRGGGINLSNLWQEGVSTAFRSGMCWMFETKCGTALDSPTPSRIRVEDVDNDDDGDNNDNARHSTSRSTSSSPYGSMERDSLDGTYENLAALSERLLWEEQSLTSPPGERAWISPLTRATASQVHVVVFVVVSFLFFFCF